MMVSKSMLLLCACWITTLLESVVSALALVSNKRQPTTRIHLPPWVMDVPSSSDHGMHFLWSNPTMATSRHSSTQLFFFRRLFKRGKKNDKSEDITSVIPVDPLEIPTKDRKEESEKEVMITTKPKRRAVKMVDPESVSICVIGGGVSGLVAAATSAASMKNDCNVVLLEGSNTFGGRVQSDITEDGFILDRGFAVFIEEYPFAKKLFDYDALKLKKFVPGALVKIKDEKVLARVADPFRQPEELISSLLAPVGSLGDKFSLIPLIWNVKSKTIDELFVERETDTLSELRNRWGFSDEIVDRFFKPFLEGIYLAPLQEQSSRMFSFVFKMFSEGCATLPEGGMGAVAQYLVSKALSAGVDLRSGQNVTQITQLAVDNGGEGGGFLIQVHGNKKPIHAQSVILATEGPVAQRLLSKIDGFESLNGLPQHPQREVGCLYYAFASKVPVREPILILNGIGAERGNKDNPVNNVCFPSVVSKSYAPQGYHLCSVTILKDAMDLYEGRASELDSAVRKQLGTWFPDYQNDILNNWELKGMYSIKNAQPGQLKGPTPANVNCGRACNSFRGKDLPKGLYVCGDHMATATLNGALESGAAAAAEALKNSK